MLSIVQHPKPIRGNIAVVKAAWSLFSFRSTFLKMETEGEHHVRKHTHQGKTKCSSSSCFQHDLPPLLYLSLAPAFADFVYRIVLLITGGGPALNEVFHVSVLKWYCFHFKIPLFSMLTHLYYLRGSQYTSRRAYMGETSLMTSHWEARLSWDCILENGTRCPRANQGHDGQMVFQRMQGIGAKRVDRDPILPI